MSSQQKQNEIDLEKRFQRIRKMLRNNSNIYQLEEKVEKKPIVEKKKVINPEKQKQMKKLILINEWIGILKYGSLCFFLISFVVNAIFFILFIILFAPLYDYSLQKIILISVFNFFNFFYDIIGFFGFFSKFYGIIVIYFIFIVLFFIFRLFTQQWVYSSASLIFEIIKIVIGISILIMKISKKTSMRKYAKKEYQNLNQSEPKLLEENPMDDEELVEEEKEKPTKEQLEEWEKKEMILHYEYLQRKHKEKKRMEKAKEKRKSTGENDIVLEDDDIFIQTEEKDYSEELKQINDMGFFENDKILKLLEAYDGCIEPVISHLIS